MIAANGRSINEAAYRNLKATIDRTYPKGRYVALYQGRVVADAASLAELLSALESLGISSKESLAVQAGADYPEYAFVLLQGMSR